MIISGGHVLDVSDKLSDKLSGILPFTLTEKDFAIEVDIEADPEFGGRRFEVIVEEALDAVEDTFRLEGFSILPEMSSEELEDEANDRKLDIFRDR